MEGTQYGVRTMCMRKVLQQSVSSFHKEPYPPCPNVHSAVQVCICLAGFHRICHAVSSLSLLAAQASALSCRNLPNRLGPSMP
jgi:hypothetical protein